MLKSYFIPLLILITTLSNAAAVNALPYQIPVVGKWSEFKDDEEPNKTDYDEIIIFDEQSNFKIYVKGNLAQSGKYSIKQSQIVIYPKYIAKNPNKTYSFSLPLTYIKVGNELRFQNKNGGWVYYQLVH